MIKDIRYNSTTFYIGRNGSGKQVGLGMTNTGETVMMEPINSKNRLAHCAINIPLDDIPKVIENLKLFL